MPLGNKNVEAEYGTVLEYGCKYQKLVDIFGGDSMRRQRTVITTTIELFPAAEYVEFQMCISGNE